MALSFVNQDEYVDLLVDHKQSSDAAWASRYVSFVKAYSDRASESFGHKNIKHEVLSHPTIQELIHKDEYKGWFKTDICGAEVGAIVDEIAHSYRLPVIRWLGFFLIKILKKTVSGLYVNKQRLDDLKSSMGDCPLIFVPTHRSYADFILMAFICFDCDIDVPCVAAGMDFYSMWLMGNILRKCKAFFMRRSFVSDALYRKVFETYVETLVTLGESPVEFFIEGTRSRTGKALWPKYGFLSMVSECYMNGNVSNLKFVPISFTYDRPLEEKLFAYELLGIPKPKESTKGLLKALSDLNQTYGNVIATVGCPISGRNFLPRAPRPHERIIWNEFRHVKLLAFEIVTAYADRTPLENLFTFSELFYRQLAGQVLTSAHLLAITVLNRLLDSETNSLTVESAVHQITHLSVLFEKAGARVMLFRSSVEDSVLDAVKSNPRLYQLNEGIIFFNDVFELPKFSDSIKVKGSKLRSTTMSLGIPRLMLQNLVNTSLHFIVWPAFFLASVYLSESRSNTDEVKDLISHFGQIFKREFVLFCEPRLEWVEALLLDCFCLAKETNDSYYLGANFNLISLMMRLFQPYFSCYCNVGTVLLKSCDTPMTMNDTVVKAQQRVEHLIENNNYQHMYSLTIDTIINCVKSFEEMKVINVVKINSSSEKSYEGNVERLTQIVRLLSKASESHSYPFRTKNKCHL